jgi:hypothetical protein
MCRVKLESHRLYHSKGLCEVELSTSPNSGKDPQPRASPSIKRTLEFLILIFFPVIPSKYHVEMTHGILENEMPHRSSKPCKILFIKHRAYLENV